MKHLQVKHIMEAVANNNHIELIIEHGYTSDLHLYGNYKKQLKNLEQFGAYNVTMISQAPSGILQILAEEK